MIQVLRYCYACSLIWDTSWKNSVCFKMLELVFTINEVLFLKVHFVDWLGLCFGLQEIGISFHNCECWNTCFDFLIVVWFDAYFNRIVCSKTCQHNCVDVCVICMAVCWFFLLFLAFPSNHRTPPRSEFDNRAGGYVG